jgi:hypothetical protein
VGTPAGAGVLFPPVPVHPAMTAIATSMARKIRVKGIPLVIRAHGDRDGINVSRSFKF